MIHALDIDFCRRRARIGTRGAILLGVAALLWGACAVRLWHAYAENDRIRESLAVVQRHVFAQQHVVKPPPSAAARLAEKQSQAVLRELTVPWQRLFSIVEDYPGHDVALIGIDQNPAQGQIRITAEAKDPDAMLAYLKYLQTSVVLREATLNGHLVEENVAGKPVRFQITAVWRKS
ncbi:hypothetical protein C7H84_15980 [Burkholderia sp. Nafp2/4-1b]|uniref:hypothetical protein n=1 Tax=Burkholderia sp. Nafp2/4-1b TaxID=2116686 RepID=UPI000EF92A03|nr:hypothetical protein [Burkholderia sp. Nafp2/4-1b]RKU02083.1 hypothetical protein C7H84_15980 [Burkholderia sp. Nafp2/4-1b]